MLDFRLFESSENLGQVQAQRPYKFYSYIKKSIVFRFIVKNIFFITLAFKFKYQQEDLNWMDCSDHTIYHCQGRGWCNY